MQRRPPPQKLPRPQSAPKTPRTKHLDRTTPRGAAPLITLVRQMAPLADLAAQLPAVEPRQLVGRPQLVGLVQHKHLAQGEDEADRLGGRQLGGDGELARWSRRGRS